MVTRASARASRAAIRRAAVRSHQPGLLVVETPLGDGAVHPAAGRSGRGLPRPGLGVLRAFAAGVAFGQRVDPGQECGAGFGAHPDLERQVPLVVGPVLERQPVLGSPAALRIPVLVVHPPPRAAEAFGLRRGRRQCELQQRRLAVGRGDAGQRPHLGVGQAAGGEGGRDLRQPAQRPGHPHVLPAGDRGHAALPGEPVPAGVDADSVPPAALVELRHEP
jgi:hypothetical protein